jgi:hypothetical protein
VAEIEWELLETWAMGSVSLYRWPKTGQTFGAGDTGKWLKAPGRNDKTVHVYGAFGGTVTIQGTLEHESPANPFTCNDSRGEGNPLTFTTTDGRTVLENIVQIRPLMGAGITGVTVLLLAVSTP